MTDSNTQLPISSKTTKCTWETATQDNILLQGNNNMIDWSTTKYYKNKKYSGFNNVPNDHLAINLQDKFISYEIPGIVANKIYEFSYDYKNTLVERINGLFKGMICNKCISGIRNCLMSA